MAHQAWRNTVCHLPKEVSRLVGQPGQEFDDFRSISGWAVSEQPVLSRADIRLDLSGFWSQQVGNPIPCTVLLHPTMGMN
jgi:hypothetical protein